MYTSLEIKDSIKVTKHKDDIADNFDDELEDTAFCFTSPALGVVNVCILEKGL